MNEQKNAHQSRCSIGIAAIVRWFRGECRSVSKSHWPKDISCDAMSYFVTEYLIVSWGAIRKVTHGLSSCAFVVSLNDLHEGATIAVYSRQLLVRGFADEFTEKSLGGSRAW